MKKVYFFSDQIKADFLKDLPDIQSGLEIIPSQGLPAAEVLQKNFDYIFLTDGDFELFKPLIQSLTWKTSHVGVADTLMRVEGGYKPLNLNADCILQVLRARNFKLDTSQPVMLIGTYDFTLSVAAKLALSGYSNISVSLVQPDRAGDFETRLKEFAFGLNVKSVPLNDLTLLQTATSLLISNLTAEMNKDAFEALAYFNFLSQGGIFVDFQSQTSMVLIEEAQRAELNTVEELEILTLKFKSLL